MENKYAAHFINAWNTVLGSFSSRQIIKTDVNNPSEGSAARDISVLMAIEGDVNGQIFMTMSANTGQVLASEMLGGMEITEVDELVTSAVGEFCNMIMGNACSSIGADNKVVDITPPMVIADKSTEIQKDKPEYIITFYFDNLEIVYFNVAFKSV